MADKFLYTGGILKDRRNVYDDILQKRNTPQDPIKSTGIYTGDVLKDKSPTRQISGAGYLGGSLGVGLASPFEGIADLVTASAALITGDKAYAEYVYKNNVTGGWQNALDDKYQPGKGMQTAGQIVGGVGQALSYIGMAALTAGIGSAVGASAGAAGGTASVASKAGSVALKSAPIFLSSTGSYTGEAVQTTGELGGKEMLYGAAAGAMETALEGISAVGGIVGRMTGKTGVMDKAFSKVVKNTVARGILSDAAGEFVEEASAELGSTWLKQLTGVDPEASTSAGQVFKAGLMGAASGAILGGMEAGTRAAVFTNTGAKLKQKGSAEGTIKTAQLLVDNMGRLTYDGVNQDIVDLKQNLESYAKSPSTTKLGEIASQMYIIETKSVIHAERAKILANLSEDTVTKVNALVPKPNGVWTMDDIRTNEGNIATIYATAVYANKLGQMTGDNSTTAQAIESVVLNDIGREVQDEAATVEAINTLGADGNPNFVAYKMPIGTSLVVKTKDGYRVGVYPDRNSSNAEWSGITYKTPEEAYGALKTMGGVSVTKTENKPSTTADEGEKAQQERKPVTPKKPTRKQIKKAKQKAKAEAKAEAEKKAEAEQKSKEEAEEKAKIREEAFGDRKYTEKDIKLCREMVENFDFLPIEAQDKLLTTARTGRQAGANEQQIKEAIAFSHQAKTTIAFSSVIKAEGMFTGIDNDYVIVVNPKDSRTATVIHEMAHRMKKTGNWDALEKYVRTVIGEEQFSAIRENYKKSYDDWRAEMEKGGTVVPELTDEQLDEEAVADALAYYLKKVPYLENKARKGFIQKAFASIVSIVKMIKNDGFATYKTAIRIQRAYEKMLTVVEQDQALREVQKFIGGEGDFVEIDSKTNSAFPTMYSIKTWNASEYVTHREQMAEKIAKALDVTVQKAESYIDDINSIAKMIADDRARLDYEASSFGSAFVSNVEYGGSFDYTTLCKKRRIYTGTFTEIQKKLKDVALTPDDILKIRNLLIEEGIEATCGLCYVEGSRANMGKFAKEFIRLYKRDNPLAWIPNMADVNTPDGVEQMRIQHPEVYEQYVYFWNHYGKLKDSDPALFASQQKPKLYEARKEYKGEILEHFKGDSTVAKKNLNGGIRMQSFSDFEIVHLIDTMQVIMDMSTVGLAGQAYTKVPEFARAFGDTGLKINLSLIAKGVDENGQLIFDDREGMPHETAFELRDKHSKNVGTILVIFTDEQLLAAMADPRIDFIIPFHRSQWKKGQYGAMGLPKGTKDYTYMQNEKLIKKTYHEYRGRMVLDKASNYMPNEYWDFSKSGKENAEAYLKMCAENNKRPKFYKLLDYDGNGTYSLKADGSTDGYWKLLIDFKMYDNDGVGSPQMAVTPTFSMDDARAMLDEYQGGHSKYPVASSVVDRFVEQYTQEHGMKYSDKASKKSGYATKITEDSESSPYDGKILYADSEVYDYLFMVSLDPMTVKTVPPLSTVKVDGRISQDRTIELGLQNAASIGVQVSENQYAVKNVYTKRDIILGKKGLQHGLDAKDIPRLRTNARLSSIGGYIVQNAVPINGLEKENKQANGTYAMACLLNDGDGFVVAIVTVDEFSSKATKFDFVEITHSINGRFLAKKEDSRSSTRELELGQESLSTTAISKISIADFLEIVNSSHQSILSNDVLEHLGKTRNPKGHYADKVLFSPPQSSTAPDPNNPFDHVDTTMPKKEKLTLAQARVAMKEFLESAQVELTNQQAAIENFLVRRGKMKRAEAASWVQAVRTSEGYGIGAVTTGQYSADGKRVGDGLFQILSPLWDEKNGTWNEKLYHEFAVYITNLHNIDRQREDKPVIPYANEEITKKVNKLKSQLKDALLQAEAEGKSEQEKAEIEAEYTKKIRDIERPYATEMSQKAVEQYERQHPEFKEIAEQLSTFNRNLNQYRVDTGLLSQEVADELNTKYPHYVPSYRLEDGMVIGTGSLKGKYNFEVQQSVKTAKGSDKTVDNPILTYIHQTISTYKAGRVNQLLKLLHDNADGEFVVTSEHTAPKTEAEADDETGATEYGKAIDRTTNSLTYWDNGKKVTIKAHKNIFAGFEGFTTTNTSAISFQ